MARTATSTKTAPKALSRKNIQKPKLRAAIYTRISRDSEKEGLGVKRQEEDCRKLAAREGFEVVRVYPENDISASTNSRKARDKYDKMLKAARAGEFDVILAYSNSRLTRRPAEWIELIELSNRDKVRIKTVVSGEHDLSTADGRAIAMTVAVWDAAEAERTSERLTRKHEQMAQDGRYNGPKPYGWDVRGKEADRHLVVNQSEKRIVVECVDRILGGESLWAITKDLNKRGIKTTTGRDWQSQVLRRTLMRWMNCGLREHRPLGEDRKRRGPSKLSKGDWKELYPREKHERLLAVLTDPNRKTNNRGTDPVYLLTSVARCGECGGYVVGAKEYTYTVKGYKRVDGTRAPSRKRVYAANYKCMNPGCMKVQRNMMLVDGHVEAVLLGVLARDGVKLFGGDPVAAKEAREEIRDIEVTMAVAATKFAERLWSSEQVDLVNAKQMPLLDAAKARLNAALPASSMAEFTGQDINKAWEKASIDKKKAVIRAIGMKIVIHRMGPGNYARVQDMSDFTTITWEGGPKPEKPMLKERSKPRTGTKA